MSSALETKENEFALKVVCALEENTSNIAPAAVDRLRQSLEEGGASRGTTAAMANLAEAIQGLVHHMRSEQQLIREWADAQGEQNGEIRKLLERIARTSGSLERES